MKALADMTRNELRAEAARLNIAGRGTMLKPELEAAIRKATELVPVRTPGMPKPASIREMHYHRQNGCNRLTPRQKRRINRKANAALARLERA